MDEPSRIVAAGYDCAADRYEQLEVDEWPRLRRLRELLADVRLGGDVLDVGCGNGVPALREISKQHRAIGVDVSEVQASRARQNVPEATILHADIDALCLPAASLDAAVAFYSIEHVPRERHADLFRRLHGWLRPGGLLLFAIEARDTHETVGDWLGVPMFFSQFGPEETLARVREARFEVESAEVEAQREGNIEVEYLWVRARRAR
jgi:cyclopropane fatty-acyl-phospholipid synthase-like methyltransferase